MPAPPKLPPEQWAALRAEYEAGGASIRALADKYGVSDAAIRKRAADTTQPGGAWRREDQGPAIAEGAARAASRVARRRRREGSQGEGSQNENEGSQNEGSREPSSPPHFLPPARLKPAYQNPTTAQMADPAFREALREEVIESVAEALARANSDHLEHRVGPLKTLYRQHLRLIMEALTTPDPDDREAVERQARAQAALIVGRSDSLGAHLQALIKMAESIQAQERRALGVEDRAKRVELSGPDGAPIRTEQAAVIDLTKLGTADMQRLYEAALILEGGRERPGIPLPPGDPPPE